MAFLFSHPPNVTVNVAAARNRCFQFRRDPPLSFNRLFVGGI
jgi:hypothetical protein